jgi:crotonobetainyl-CoA:carnitine CoA-transferase CaiB-like acyl-CoA transferase
MWRMTPPDAPEPVGQPGSVGDLTGGLSVALGVSAALFQRERTGVAEQVDVSLYGVGICVSSQSVGAANLGLDYKTSGPVGVRNPLVNSYRTADGRWLMLCMLQPDPYWADFCLHIDRVDLVDDSRFTNIDNRNAHCAELVTILEETFASWTLDAWRDAFRTLKGVWAPALSAREIVDEPQVAANEYLPEVHDAAGEVVRAPDGTVFRSATAPVQFGGQTVGPLRAMPESGQHTEEILLERGREWETIGRLKEAGVIT